MSERTITNGIAVEVESFFMPDHSDREQGRFVFSYRIRICNEDRKSACQLLSRHWVITDGFGRREEVQGPGVIGQQPRLQPGETFEYESFCPLPTTMGTMTGTYQMLCLESGENFEAQIPQFFLVEPSTFH
jgi:ApaG protein